jgi:hypothetical protein
MPSRVWKEDCERDVVEHERLASWRLGNDAHGGLFTPSCRFCWWESLTVYSSIVKPAVNMGLVHRGNRTRCFCFAPFTEGYHYYL